MKRTPAKILFYSHLISHLIQRSVRRSCLTFIVSNLLLLFGPTSLSAQQVPQLVLADSRGPMADDTLIIGRDLRVGLAGGRADHRYRFRLQDETGAIVAEDFGKTNAVGSIDAFELWDKTGLQGCWPSKPKSPHQYGSLSEVSAALDGSVFKLTVFDLQAKSTVTSSPISLRETQEAIYYWSDAAGNAKCIFEQRERIYLSVFKGDLETWDTESRVFMFEKPVKKEDWEVGMSFVDVRKRVGCDPNQETCDYPLGSIEKLPQTSTVEIEGIAPLEGAFLAIIRPAEGWKDTLRHACDRVTESVMYIHSMPVDLNDNEDGWGCPPCPP